MDWELYERYRSTLLLAGLILISSLLLAFQKNSSVQHLRTLLVRFRLPPQRFLSQLTTVAPSSEAPAAVPSREVNPSTDLGPIESFRGEDRRRVQILSDENSRLRDVLRLKESKWPRAVVCRVAGRDPQRWFQEIILDKGKEDGLDMDWPVLAVVEGRESVVGRIVEVSARVSKVMLLQDSLSEVAATVIGTQGEDGVVEGTNTHDLILKFLDRGSQVRVGDLVVTSGLGKAFPPNIPIGWVENIEPDPRQLFLQAKLRPAARSNQLRIVLVLVQ